MIPIFNTTNAWVLAEDPIKPNATQAIVHLGLAQLERLIFTRDDVRAYYWLKKVADGECEFKHLAEEHITQAALLVGLLEPFGG